MTQSVWQRWRAAIRQRLTLAPHDLLRERGFRRLWMSTLMSSTGAQITMLALPLTAALLLQASPQQMGWLTALELAPFVLFSLPSGVWLDRVRKLPVYVVGELSLAAALVTVPVAFYLDSLSIAWLYVVAFWLGTVHTVAGTAAQVVLTQVVPRDRLVEAHAKNALASSGPEVAGPALGGVLIKLVGPPVALLLDALLLAGSALVLKGIHVSETVVDRGRRFSEELFTGLRFVRGNSLLPTLSWAIGGWQFCHYTAMVVQILVASRELGLSPGTIGLTYVALGVGTVLGSVKGHAISQKLGPGPCLVLGMATTGVGWGLAALAPAGPWGVVAFATMLGLFGLGAVLIFINFLGLRQAVTPDDMLGRVTSTMRWLTVIPGAPGALLGGWLGQHWGLRHALGAAGLGVLLLAVLAWRSPTLRRLRALPQVDHDSAMAAV
ncbi:MFS transporter [Inhella gelatinilytica]|uniref:MFS transporter n=1 Tax=Inhella gelatinilytica TaxID=2795030 RepID=A0A931IV03_9BURK|nr:MFS transporter [Inhella gelatinilytica]MBH9553282.1 MFS transporter [Inhella gelatinilytica]